MSLEPSTLRSGRRTLMSLLGNRASPPDLCFLLAEVLGQLRLDLVASELRHLLCTLDRADAIGPGAGEDDVHLFETSALRLREEEVDGGNQGGVEHGEDDVGAPGQIGEGRGSDHDDDELTPF